MLVKRKHFWDADAEFFYDDFLQVNGSAPWRSGLFCQFGDS